MPRLPSGGSWGKPSAVAEQGRSSGTGYEYDNDHNRMDQSYVHNTSDHLFMQDVLLFDYT